MIFRIFNIAIANLLLSSDNVLIIALFGKSLTKRKRIAALLWSMLFSVVLQLGILYIMAFLFKITLLQAIFGLIICYMAFHLLSRHESEHQNLVPENKTFFQSVWKIVLGNLMMSFENEATLISLAAGNPWLAWFGIILTSPFIFFGSHLISSLLKKYDFIIYIGAAILFKIGLDLVFNTPYLTPYALTGSWVLEGLFVIYVIRAYLIEKGITLFRVKLH